MFWPPKTITVLVWVVILWGRFCIGEVDFQFLTTWSWIVQTILWTAVILDSKHVVAAFPAVWNLAFGCFVGVTVIAAANPILLLRPDPAIGIVNDHVSHSLNVIMLALFAHQHERSKQSKVLQRIGPTIVLLVLYRILYDPSDVYGVQWGDAVWCAGALGVVLLGDGILTESQCPHTPLPTIQHCIV